ncbi:MAG: hypothetical protein WAK16_01305 [Candidatus Cybelea sp.]
MRVGFRTLLSLILCAAAAGAALAHWAIDIVGDYALAHDSYDNLAHDSRGLISGIALTIAVVLAARGLRHCCEIAIKYRARAPQAPVGARAVLGLLIAAVAVTLILVPAMEWFDGRLDGAPVQSLSAAFGGSLLLGIATTAICASLVGALVYALARWLVAYRDAIATVLETLLRRNGDAVLRRAYKLESSPLTFDRAPDALRISRRGPPVTLPA